MMESQFSHLQELFSTGKRESATQYQKDDKHRVSAHYVQLMAGVFKNEAVFNYEFMRDCLFFMSFLLEEY